MMQIKLFKITVIITSAFILLRNIMKIGVFFSQLYDLLGITTIVATVSDFLYMISLLLFAVVVLLRFVFEKFYKLERTMEGMMFAFLSFSALCILFSIMRIIRRAVFSFDSFFSPFMNSLELLSLFLLFASFVGIVNCHRHAKVRYKKFAGLTILAFAIAVIVIYAVSAYFFGFSYIVGDVRNYFDTLAVINIVEYICLITSICYIFMHPVIDE